CPIRGSAILSTSFHESKGDVGPSVPGSAEAADVGLSLRSCRFFLDMWMHPVFNSRSGGPGDVPDDEGDARLARGSHSWHGTLKLYDGMPSAEPRRRDR